MNRENQDIPVKKENKNQSNCCDTENDSSHEGHHHDDGHDHGGEPQNWKSQWPLLTALSVLLVMQVLYFGFHINFTPYLDQIGRAHV